MNFSTVSLHYYIVCFLVQVPKPKDTEVVGNLNIFIENEGETIVNSSKILVKTTKSSLLVQSDKAVYKPGQTGNR